MKITSAEPAYRIWGADNVVHGPVNLPALTEWVRAKRVTSGTWVFLETEKDWVRAADMPQLNLFLGSHQKGKPEVVLRAREMGVTPEVLRRIKILAQMDVNQLERFIEFIEVLAIDTAGVVVRKGSQGDAMYLVFEGEVRARVLVDDKETILATLFAGDFFGEISLLDQGPRSADVVANEQSLLLKVTVKAFERMKKEAPDVALPFLFNVSRSAVTRMRRLTKRYEDSLHLWHVFDEQ
jgi:CRP-like cAMP-binding protein